VDRPPRLYGIGMNIWCRSSEQIDVKTVEAKWIDRQTKSSVTLQKCPKCTNVLTAKNKNKPNTFVVAFNCTGFHGSAFRPMNVIIQAITTTGKLLESASFVLKGSRKKDPNGSFHYCQEKADENPPVPALSLRDAPDLQPTTIQDNQDQSNRANPPQPTPNQELLALTENPSVPTCIDGFSSDPRFSIDEQELDSMDFCGGRIDN